MIIAAVRTFILVVLFFIAVQDPYAPCILMVAVEIAAPHPVGRATAAVAFIPWGAVVFFSAVGVVFVVPAISLGDGGLLVRFAPRLPAGRRPSLVAALRDW